jgi:hypothetical protein
MICHLIFYNLLTKKKIINILTANFSKYNSVSIILLPRYLLKGKQIDAF